VSTIQRSAAVSAAPTRTATEDFPSGGLRFDLIAASLACWPVFGLYLDGFAHVNLGVVETFLTPWHALLYSGVVVLAGFYGFHEVQNVRRGHDWRRALPRGYDLSLLGAGIFLLGGGVDFFWHWTFGFEANVETLLSPPHVMLALGATLMFTGPLRAALWRPSDETPPGWAGLLPTMLSLLLVLSILTFFTQYVHFTTDPGLFVGDRPATPYLADLLGAASMIIYTTTLMAIVLFALRRWTLPLGSMTLLISGNTAMMFLMRYKANVAHVWPVLAVVGAGVLADAILVRLNPSARRPMAFHAFAFLVPSLVFLAYNVTLVATVGTWWSVHMWLGLPIQAGAVGLLVSYLVLPPAP